MAEKSICFVISEIGPKGSEQRTRADTVCDCLIRPVATAAGYEVRRSDDIARPGQITTQILNHILHSPLIIADLSGHNGNVYYELAVAHAFGRRLIQMIAQDEQLPFDVRDTRTIHFNMRDWGSLLEARQQLETQIVAVENGEEGDNPIAQFAEIEKLRTSQIPVEQHLADVMQQMASLRSDMKAGFEAHNRRSNQAFHWVDMDTMMRSPAYGHMGAQAQYAMSTLAQPSGVQGAAGIAIPDTGDFDSPLPGWATHTSPPTPAGARIETSLSSEEPPATHEY